MNLKITSAVSGFRTGAMARLFLDDIDVSHAVSRVVLTVDVTLYASGVDVDTPVHNLVVVREIAA